MITYEINEKGETDYENDQSRTTDIYEAYAPYGTFYNMTEPSGYSFER